MLFSGELSMTTSLLLPLPEEPGLAPVAEDEAVELDPLDEQAARAAARRPAAVSASALFLVTLLIVNFDLPLGCRDNEED
jgi:hypothetical protein